MSPPAMRARRVRTWRWRLSARSTASVTQMPEPNAFTGAVLDRAADGRRRDEAWLASQAGDPRSRVLVVGTAGVAMRDGRLAYIPLESAPTAGEPRILLGVDQDG